MTKHPATSPMRPARTLNLIDAVCVIVGTIIGSGIFGAADNVAQLLGNQTWFLLIWLIGGLLSFMGALCFAELTTSYDEPGGDYYYLRRAFGDRTGFAFAWAAFWIIRPGNIGAMAMIFAEYGVSIFDWWGDSIAAQMVLAVTAVVVLSVLNLIGIRFGKTAQNVLTFVKVAGILAIFVASAVAIDEGRATAPAEASDDAVSFGSFFIAMVLVMFAFGGWNDISFVATEVKHPDRNLKRSLILGVLVVTIAYFLFNLSLIITIGFGAIVSAETPAPVQMMEIQFGRWGQWLLSSLVCVSCLGAINGMIFTSPRIYFAVGQRYPQFAWLANWGRRDGPWAGMICQALISVSLIVLCGFREDGFDQILVVTAPYFWIFLSMTLMSLVLLRRQNLKVSPQAFRVPLYPWTPILMALVSLAIVYSSIRYILDQRYYLAALVVAGLMVVGIVLAMILRPGPRQSESSSESR